MVKLYLIWSIGDCSHKYSVNIGSHLSRKWEIILWFNPKTPTCVTERNRVAFMGYMNCVTWIRKGSNLVYLLLYEGTCYERTWIHHKVVDVLYQWYRNHGAIGVGTPVKFLYFCHLQTEQYADNKKIQFPHFVDKHLATVYIYRLYSNSQSPLLNHLPMHWVYAITYP